MTHPWVYAPRTPLADGLYRVETPTFVAGFLVSKGRVVRCAPILRKRLDYWTTRAVKQLTP